MGSGFQRSEPVPRVIYVSFTESPRHIVLTLQTGEADRVLKDDVGRSSDCLGASDAVRESRGLGR